MIKELRKTIEQARVEVDPTSEEGDKTKWQINKEQPKINL
jgi:hypothetical protein